MSFRKLSIFALALRFGFITVSGQVEGDTLYVTLPEADSLFISKNLPLLSQKYNIDENEANVIQARIWDRPNITVMHNLYNPSNKKYFEFSSTSESSAQIQQLILIAGKRHKLISMAENNKQIAQYQYFDLVRNLKYQLHTSFYNIYYLEKKLQIFNTEVPLLRKILGGYQTMYPKGFVSLKEVVRLKALLFGLESDKLDLMQQLNENEDNVRLMIGEKESRYIHPLPNLTLMDSINPNKYKVEALVDTALHNRLDLLIYKVQDQYAQTNLSYQRSLSVPNPTLIAGWDHNGSFVQNYNYLGLSIDLPFWNQNRGNVKVAEARIKENKTNYEYQIMEVNSQVEQSYKTAIETERLYRATDTGFGEDFTRIITGTTESFLKHQIGLLEFVDLYESYKDSQTQLLQLQNNRMNALENLNFSVGKPLN
jgi:cobalt-zinc-cadmium efflux system outer membrane protein